ncbi:hypothetical protein [Bremerella cremea]|uniref:hypothetical protein n=1 Tax=Bremerella cremea TaxID=1031537 RepID=UPI0031F1AA40
MFDLRKHSSHSTGKPKSIRRVGMQTPKVETFLDYQVEIAQRAASPISKRVVFSVKIDGGEPLLQAYLTGFLSESSARAAAHEEIKKLDFKYGQSVSPISNILTSLKKQRAFRRMQEKKKGV